jgi:hypothetical protein
MGRSKALEPGGPPAPASGRAETLAEEAEQRRLRLEREEEERRLAWEKAMVIARERALEHHHVETLRRRVDAWEEADRTRAYCNAVEERHAEAIASDPEATRWLQFARQHADRAQRLPRMPSDPELNYDDLKPFRDGWSPHGPSRTGGSQLLQQVCRPRRA